jgi:hypothetical protein
VFHLKVFVTNQAKHQGITKIKMMVMMMMMKSIKLTEAG